jgi:hypothetical protein
MDSAELSFLDGKLVMIELDLEKEIEAAALARIYGINFSPKVTGFAEALFPKDYERNAGRVYPKTYPSIYQAVAVSPGVFIGAFIANNSVGSLLRQSAGVRDTGEMPGKVVRLQIVSRRLENFDGADALK